VPDVIFYRRKNLLKDYPRYRESAGNNQIFILRPLTECTGWHRSATRLHECLINSGITDAEARGMIKKTEEAMRKKVEKEGIKESDDFFVF
jgi:hypothetical protein